MHLAAHLIPHQAVPLSRHAERLGYDAVVIGEGGSSDAPSVIGMVAGQTRRIGLVSGVMQIPARSPGMAALTAATLTRMSGGRFRLGLGVSNPDVAEGWYGAPSDRPLARTREYVHIVRRALRGEPVQYSGRYYRLPAGERRGMPLQVPAHPDGSGPAVYLAAVGGKNIALAAEIGDGWIGAFSSPESLGAAVREIRAIRQNTGLDPADFEIMPSLPTVFTDDVQAGVNQLRTHYAHFLSMGDPEHNVFVRAARRMGHEAEMATFLSLVGQGELGRAAEVIPARLIDRTALVGPVARVADRMRAYADAGATTLTVMLSPARADDDGVVRILRHAVEALALSGAA